MTEPREELVELVPADTHAALMAEAQQQTRETLPDFLERMVSAAVADADAKVMMLRSELDESRSKRLLLELCLSCILPIAEEHAEQTKNDIYTRTCAFIRSSLGKPPRKGKPALVVVKNGEA